MKNDRKFAEDWQKKRGKRWTNAIFFSLVYGASVFILIGLVDLSSKSIQEIYFTQHALIQLIGLILAGYFFGAFFIWSMHEERYKRILKKKQENHGEH